MKNSFGCSYNVYYAHGSMSSGYIQADSLKLLRQKAQEFQARNGQPSLFYSQKDVEAITYGEVTKTTHEYLGRLIKDVIRVKKPKNRYLKLTS